MFNKFEINYDDTIKVIKLFDGKIETMYFIISILPRKINIIIAIWAINHINSLFKANYPNDKRIDNLIKAIKSLIKSDFDYNESEKMMIEAEKCTIFSKENDAPNKVYNIANSIKNPWIESNEMYNALKSACSCINTEISINNFVENLIKFSSTIIDAYYGELKKNSEDATDNVVVKFIN